MIWGISNNTNTQEVFNMFHDFDKIPAPGMGRRHFLRGIAAGTAGLAAGTVLNPGSAHALFGSDKSRVNLVHNTDIRQSAYDSMVPFRDDIKKAIGNKKVVLKVNTGLVEPQYAKNTTHADSVRGVLDFLSEFHKGEILISEGVGGQTTQSVFVAYENFGYLPIEKEYKNAKLIDANDLPYSQRWIHQWKMRPVSVDVIDMYMDPNVYLISLAKIKTHGTVVGTF